MPPPCQVHQNPSLRMSLRIPLPSVHDAVAACPEKYMLTLTTRRSLDGIAMSQAVGEMLHRLNRALFGTAYTKHRKIRLAVLAIQEFSYSQELHTHAVIGIPADGRRCKAFPTTASIEELIISIWCSLDHGGEPQAQDIQPIYDLMGACRYITKTIYNPRSLDRIDINNCNIPL